MKGKNHAEAGEQEPTSFHDMILDIQYNHLSQGENFEVLNFIDRKPGELWDYIL